MRKSTIFISAVLTTFALALLYGVVSAYRANTSSSSAVQEVAALTEDTPTPEPTPAPTATAHLLTPDEAAQLAAQVVGNTNLLSAESSSINGLDAYKITFTNQDVVYVGLDGQILGVQVAPVVVNVAAPVQHKNREKNHDSAPVTNTGGEDNHEDHEQHE